MTAGHPSGAPTRRLPTGTVRERIAALCAEPGGATARRISDTLGINYSHANVELRALAAQRRVVGGAMCGRMRLWHTPDSLPNTGTVRDAVAAFVASKSTSGACARDVADALGIGIKHASSELHTLMGQSRVVRGWRIDGQVHYYAPRAMPAEKPAGNGGTAPLFQKLQADSQNGRLVRAIEEAGDAGRMPAELVKLCDLTGEQVRRLLWKLHGAGRVHRAPEPHSVSSRYFATPEAAGKWRRLHAAALVALSPAEKRGVQIALRKRADTEAAKAAGLAAPVTLHHDPRAKVHASAEPIWTGKERRIVAEHRPDPRYYVDPASVPRLFSALRPGQYPEIAA